MVAMRHRIEERRETLAAELAEAAFIAAARHGVQCSSIDLEIALWRVMRAALVDSRRWLTVSATVAIDNRPAAAVI